MTKQYFTAIPLRTETLPDGRRSHIIEKEGIEYKVCSSCAHPAGSEEERVHCVFQQGEDGTCRVTEDRYYVLNSLYGLQGNAMFRVSETGIESSSAMNIVCFTDSFGFTHSTITRADKKHFPKGSLVSCNYRLKRDQGLDGVLELTPLHEANLTGFIDPGEIFQECRRPDNVLKCYVAFSIDSTSVLYKRMIAQMENGNNLWIFTFANYLHDRIKALTAEECWATAREYTAAYRDFEETIRSHEEYLRSFSEEKKRDLLEKAEIEIHRCMGLHTALVWLEKRNGERVIGNLLRKSAAGTAITYMEAAGVHEFVVLAIQKHSHLTADILRLVYNICQNGVYDYNTVKGILTSLENVINQRLVHYNGNCHLGNGRVDEDNGVELVRLSGLLLLATTKIGVTQGINVKLARLCRLTSNILTDSPDLARRLLVKGCSILASGVPLPFTKNELDDFDAHLFARCLIECPTMRTDEPFVYQENGQIIFEDGQIRVLPAAHMGTDGTIPYNRLHGLNGLPVSLCSRRYHYLNGLQHTELPEAVTAWNRLYVPVKAGKQRSHEPTLKGDYVMKFTHLNQDNVKKAYFVSTESGDQPKFKCILFPSGIFTAGGTTLEGLFENGTTLSVTVSHLVREGLALCKLDDKVETYAAGKVAMGDMTDAVGLYHSNGQFVLYGANGSLYVTEGDKTLSVGAYYLLSTQDMEPDGRHRKAQVEGAGKEFDAQEVNRQVIREYIQKHRLDRNSSSTRIYATELLFILDSLANLEQDIRERFVLYQYIKMIACIERSNLSFLFDILITWMTCQTEKERLAVRSNTPAYLMEKFPRLARLFR